jgi:hypothetical protein
MTTPPTTDLPAGPSLTMLVAEIIGLKIHSANHEAVAASKPGERSYWSNRDGTIWYVYSEDLCVHYTWNPETNIADAFEALGVMRGKGWEYQIECSSPPGNLLCCLVQETDVPESDFADRFEYHGQFIATGFARTPELAISRAIVRAGKGGGG